MISLISQLYSGQILTGSGVDLQLIADLNKQRNHDLSAGLNDSGFGSAGSGIALEAGLGIGHFQLYEERRLNGEDIALVGADLDHLIVFDEFQGIADGVLIQSDLIISLNVHEIEEIAIRIQILHIYSVDMSSRELLSGTEGFFNHAAADDVFQFGSYERCSFSGLYVLEFNDLIDVVVHLKRNAVSKITC